VSGERLAWWYVDPLDASRARYWDGSGWTEYVASIPAGKVLTPLPPMAPRRTSGAAVAALVSSVLGLGIFGVLFGHAGLQRINRSSGSLTGRGLAGVGMTLGYLEVAAMLVVAGAMLDVHATPRSSTPSCAVITTTGDCAPTPRVVTQADHAVESAEPQPSATISITATGFAPLDRRRIERTGRRLGDPARRDLPAHVLPPRHVHLRRFAPPPVDRNHLRHLTSPGETRSRRNITRARL